ncbi:hypothetical protein [Mesoaciditoga lauensis]|uniref:hypothetical protein n=1 Tax=Mesoaciditoga lauensis TaxID=1495039 RepID=UPI00056BEE3F|nr:hypothetical protein [Mesoaciditoga lauensis]
MDLTKVAKDAFGIADWILGLAFPWWGKAKVLLIQAAGMAETIATTEKGSAKRQMAIDIFEKRIVEAGLIPESVEKAIDPVLDWGLEWALDALIKYLNKTFGKDWLKVVAPSKVQNVA